jgi:hypothetical protein
MAETPEPVPLDTGSAIAAAVIGRSEAPKALEICRRRISPDSVARMVCLIVLFWKTTPVSFCFPDCQS